MNENKRLIGQIEGLAKISIGLIVMMMLFVVLGAGLETSELSRMEPMWIVISLWYSQVCWILILCAIINGCESMKTKGLFTKEVAKIIQFIAKVFIAKGIGSSLMESIGCSQFAGSIRISINVTELGIGILLLVAAYIYLVGCEKKEELEYTV